MMTGTMASQMDYVLFSYGVSLFLLSGVCWALRVSPSPRLPWVYLGIFGFLHGAAVWLEMLHYSFDFGSRIQMIRLVLVIASFVSLLEFGRISYRDVTGKGPGRLVTAVLLSVSLLGLPGGMDSVEAICRYSLCLTGGIWSAVALHAQWTQSRSRAGGHLLIIACILGAYTLVTGLVTPRASAFPASIINHGSFLSVTKCPDQLVGGILMAFGVGLLWRFFCITQMSSSFARAIHTSLRYEHWYSLVIVLTVLMGWMGCNIIARNQHREMVKDVMRRTQIAASSDSDKVRSLQWSIRDLDSPAYRSLKSWLVRVRRSNPDVRFVSLMGFRKDGAYILADSEPPSSQDYSPPGQAYSEVTPQEISFSNTHRPVVMGPASDRWGTWITGYAPLMDLGPRKGFVALAMDYDAHDWQMLIARHRLEGIVMVLCLVLLVLTGFALQRWSFVSAIAVSEERYRSLVESVPECVFLLSTEGLCISADGKGLDIMEKDSSELVGKGFAEFFSTDSLPMIEYAMQQALQGESCSVEASSTRSGDRPLVWEVSVSPILDDSGRVRGFVGVASDVTERRQSEALVKEKEAAEIASRAKSDFLAVMSHEIRTPLNGIVGMTELMLDTDLDDEQLHLAHTISKETEAMLALIHDVLDFSKIEAGRLELESVPFDLQELIEDTVETMSVRAHQKGIELTSLIATDVPTALVGDPVRIRQVLVNLIGNAVKFTHVGKVEITTQLISDCPQEAKLRFTVNDTGIGIAADKLGKIFESFTQVDNSTTRKYGGTGLGTTISKRLVELMHGSIGAESTVGKGSTFHFTLELQKEQCELAPSGCESAMRQGGERSRRDGVLTRGGKAEPDSANAWILLVEDYPTNQEVALQYLLRAGHIVDLAANGYEAAEAFSIGNYDLVLMDIEMPGMDGYEATRAIRRIEVENGARKRVPIVAMTAHAVTQYIDRTRECGMDDHIEKPLRRKSLLSMVRKWTTADPAKQVVAAQTAPSQLEMPIDLDAALEEFGGNHEFLEHLLRGFLESVGCQIEAMRQALVSGDVEILRREAHSIKGGAANLMANSLSDAAAQLETVAKTGALDSASELLGQIETAFGALSTYAYESERMRRTGSDT